MNPEDLLKLRDYLFEKAVGPVRPLPLFQLLAVTRTTEPGFDAVIHFAGSSPRWRLAGLTGDPVSLLCDLIAQTDYKDLALAFEHHDLRQGWPVDWPETRVEPGFAFPTLVLRDVADGKVQGLAIKNLRHGGNLEGVLAAQFFEPTDASAIVARLMKLPVTGKLEKLWTAQFVKEANVGPCSLTDVLASASQSPGGQTVVLLYRQGEWLSGVWSNPEKVEWSSGELQLTSVADFHGTPVSELKRKSRSGLDALRSRKTLEGDYAVLASAASWYVTDAEIVGTETHPGVAELCAWWNSLAPEMLRSAGFFRAYIWDDKNKIFEACDPQEPAGLAPQFEQSHFALFEAPGKPTVLVEFFRGSIYNKRDGGIGTAIFQVDGNEAYTVGEDLADADEALFSVHSLKRLNKALTAPTQS
jgi:hypothetical protein